jgi:hypothetical protein
MSVSAGMSVAVPNSITVADGVPIETEMAGVVFEAGAWIGHGHLGDDVITDIQPIANVCDGKLVTVSQATKFDALAVNSYAICAAQVANQDVTIF